MTMVARLVAMNNGEASRLGDSGRLRAHDSEENQVAVDGNWNATSFRAVMEDLPREYLFDKAVTPSDVGKLNRLVIPKQHAQKYFPLDGNSNEKGLLLDFEDNTGKVWRFRYAYWKSSQSYVLTKGWSRFVKDKKLKAGDIVSFQRASAQPRQLYITRRHRLLAQPQLGIGPGSGQSKRRVLYPAKGSWATVVNKAQLMPIFWPSSSNPDAFTQFNFRLLSAHSKDAAWFNVALLSAPSTEQMVQSRFYDIGSDGLQPIDLHLNLHNCLNSSEGSINIKPAHPFVNPVQSNPVQAFAGRDWETPEHKAASSLDPTTKKGIRLFGVTLA